MKWDKRFKNSITATGSASPIFCSFKSCNLIGQYELTIIGYPGGYYCQRHKPQMEEAWNAALRKFSTISKESAEKLSAAETDTKKGG